MKLPRRIASKPLRLTYHATATALVAAAVAARLACAAAAATPQQFSPASLPFGFEELTQRAGAAPCFIARGPDSALMVSPNGVTLTLARGNLPVAASRAERTAMRHPRLVRSVRLEFVNAAAQARMVGLEALPAHVHYLLGNDPAQWRTRLTLFSRVQVRDLYPGVDVIYYNTARRIEYDLHLAPGTDPRTIVIRVIGADALRLDTNGDLLIWLGDEDVRQPRPVAYQVDRGTRRTVHAAYRLLDSQTFGFELGAYDPALPLVIDPVLSYATFFGGAGSDIAWDLALDAAGNIYVAGESMSAGLATPGAFQTTNRMGTSLGGDVFVAKFDNLATNLIYATYLGGSGDDAALGLAVSADGRAFLTGFTTSTNFPIANALRPAISGSKDPVFGVYPMDGFVTALSSNGASLLFSTYLGGNSHDEGIGIALDPTGNIYVTGFTDSTNFPTAGSTRTNYAGGRDAFVTKLAPGGTNFVYSFFLGGTNVDNGEGIVADSAGNAYVVGFTASTNFPLTNAIQAFLNNPLADTNIVLAGNDAFLTILSPGGALLRSTLLGGGRDDVAFRVALDPATNVFIAGSTRSPDFPVAPPGNTNLPRGVSAAISIEDVFVTKLAPDATNWTYSVIFGGRVRDEAWDVAADASGQAHLVGVTFSTNFPTADTSGFLRATNAGGGDVFVAVLGPAGTNLVRSAYLGGRADDYGYAIKLDPAGNEYLVGRTASTNFPTVTPYQPAFAGTNDAFLAKIIMEPPLLVAPSPPNVLLSWPAFLPEFTLESSANITATNAWQTVPVAPALSAGQHVVTLPATNGLLHFRLRKR
ncbi:MAG: SBBP repeat-containing protein [Verrucomicrobiae bacterium]|nr:SBBP repeat-containing protein [Verrucomicrobiae bacterium]